MSFLDREKSFWFTHGPNTDKPEMAPKMIETGATGVRLSMSYGDQDLKDIQCGMFRKAAENLGKDIDIIADLPGEKVSLGELGERDEIDLSEGEKISLVSSEEDFGFSEMKLPMNSDILIGNLEEGDTIYIGDGDALLEVESAEESIDCRVLKSGTVHPFRGLKPQSDIFEPSALTEKDEKDLRYIAKSGNFDAALISFVSRKEDVKKARQILEENGSEIPVVSKIESRKGVENIEEICKVSDAVMAARGDLALFLPWHELGENVEKIARAAEKTDTPWILATQVLEGMERFPIPSRADICDVHHWNQKGADGFMLCYETAFGDKPVEAVEALRKIVEK